MRSMDALFFNIFLYFVFLWSLFWKGIALWRAANGGQKIWFIAMLILSTVGILEIIYLFWFAKSKLTLAELRSWFDEYTLPVKNKLSSHTIKKKK